MQHLCDKQLSSLLETLPFSLRSMAQGDANFGHNSESQIADTPDLSEPLGNPAEDQPVISSLSEVSTKISLKKMVSTQCSTYHIPALVGWPNAGNKTLRQRPILTNCNPQDRRCFTLSMYAMLTSQVAVTALIAAAVAGHILSDGGSLEMGSSIYWMPGYPFDVLIALFPTWLCTVSSFVALSYLRAVPQTRRLLLVVCTVLTGIHVGMHTYLEKSFGMLFIGVVLMSLILHSFSISVNLVSSLALSLGVVKPKASKMEIMARTSYLTGTEKLICMLYDEEAAHTRAAVAMAGSSWIAASMMAALIVAAQDMAWLPCGFAVVAACPTVLYFTYGVEKQVRRCKAGEMEKAMVNLCVDLLFFLAECIVMDLNIMKWQELGTAQPIPATKGAFQFAMKQVTSNTTQSTAVSSSVSKSTSEQRLTVAV